jgi:hypothetical protein
MAQSVFITAGMISFVYLIIKYLETKFILKEAKPMKILFRDTLIVYLSVVSGSLVVEQFAGAPISTIKPTEIFTNEPAF